MSNFVFFDFPFLSIFVSGNFDFLDFAFFTISTESSCHDLEGRGGNGGNKV